jgi:hypothetical protein
MNPLPLLRRAGLLLAALPFSLMAAAEISLPSLLREMTDRDAIAKWPVPAYTCKQASSYDRLTTTADKPEWFANKDFDQCIRTETIDGRQEFVIMDVEGPGAITRFWKAGDDPQNRVRIYLDGSATPVVDEVADAWLGGKLWVKEPFAAVRARGINLYLPIPYAKHCKVTLDKLKADWYNIEYRTYPAGTQVISFSRADCEANAKLLEETGSQLTGKADDLPPDLALTETKTGKLATGQSLTLSVTGPAAIRELMVQIKAKNQAQALRSTVLSITCDGEPTVWAPVGDFFGSGVGLNPYRDWYRSVNRDGQMRCRWVMPCKTSGMITLTNLGKETVEATLYRLQGKWTWDDRSMHFHSTWRQQYPIQTKRATGTADWNYVSITGRGVYVGDTLAIHNGSGGWWGEGDEKIVVDGEAFPSHFGTGTEDYYGYAWGHPAFFEAPFHAQPQWRGNNHVGHTTDTRTRSLDAIPFAKSLNFDMEIWHWDATEVAYAATTYWYALPGATSNRQPDAAEAARAVPPGNLDRAEGETMPVTFCTGGTTEIQSEARWGWSRGSQLWWRDAKPGDQLDLTFNLETDGPCKLGAIITTARDYGIVQLTLDGVKLGDPVDGYTPAVQLRILDLGRRDLKAGTHVLSFKITGSNPAAEPRHMVGLDCFTIIPVP